MLLFASHSTSQRVIADVAVTSTHQSACIVVERLGRRGFPVENAAARVCRDAGKRVRSNAFLSRHGPVRDLSSVDVPELQQGPAHAAWIRRWSSIVACADARAFVVSLLEKETPLKEWTGPHRQWMQRWVMTITQCEVKCFFLPFHSEFEQTAS